MVRILMAVAAMVALWAQPAQAARIFTITFDEPVGYANNGFWYEQGWFFYRQPYSPSSPVSGSAFNVGQDGAIGFYSPAKGSSFAWTFKLVGIEVDASAPILFKDMVHPAGGYVLPVDAIAGPETMTGLDNGIITPYAELRTQDGSAFRVLSLTLAAVPEPSTWALLILGFGLIGVGLRRHGATTIVMVEPAAAST